MFKFFAFLTVIAFLAVVATLVMGAVSMKNREKEGREASNKWMQRRVIAQATAVILLFITVSLKP